MPDKIILVGEEGPDLKEIKLLCERIDMEIMKSIKPSSDRDPSHYLGKGRLEDLEEELRKQEDISKVVVAEGLDFSTKHRLQKKIGPKLLDRGDIVLQVFEKEGGSSLTGHQIERARLERKMPMLRKKETSLKNFVEPAKRTLKNLDKKIEREKEKFEESMDRLLNRGYLSFSFLGYTNAGKSTFFNYLSEEEIDVKDELFTTLKQNSKVVRIHGYPCLMIDTLGLFKEIPHELMPAFHSTLYAAKESDFPLLILDSTEEEQRIKDKLEVSVETLQDLGIDEPIPVFNKIDRKKPTESKKRMVESMVGKEPFSISAATGEGVDELTGSLLDSLELSDRSFEIHYRDNPDRIINKVSDLPLKMDIEKGSHVVSLKVIGKSKAVEELVRLVEKLR